MHAIGDVHVTHRHEVFRDVRSNDATGCEGQMTMDPENFTWPGMTAELCCQGNGTIGNGTDAPVDGHDQRHSLLITAQRPLLILVKALKQVVVPAGLRLVWI